LVLSPFGMVQSNHRKAGLLTDVFLTKVGSELPLGQYIALGTSSCFCLQTLTRHWCLAIFVVCVFVLFFNYLLFLFCFSSHTDLQGWNLKQGWVKSLEGWIPILRNTRLIQAALSFTFSNMQKRVTMKKKKKKN